VESSKNDVNTKKKGPSDGLKGHIRTKNRYKKEKKKAETGKPGNLGVGWKQVLERTSKKKRKT